MNQPRQKRNLIRFALVLAFPLSIALIILGTQPSHSARLLLENSNLISEIHGRAESFLLPDPQFSEHDFQLAALGRKLFFDTRLSANQQVSCATCHQPGRSFTDGLKRGRGISEVQRNTPTIINSHSNFWFFWDGRADSLAAQAISPLEHPHEHGLTRTEIVAHVLRHYRNEFEGLFGRLPAQIDEVVKTKASPPLDAISLPEKILTTALPSITDKSIVDRIYADSSASSTTPEQSLAMLLLSSEDRSRSEHSAYQSLDLAARNLLNQAIAQIGLAIEAYERGLVANQSPFDRFIAAWSQSERNSYSEHFNADFGENEFAGFMIFNSKANCTLCHTGPNFTDNQFHNIALPPLSEQIDIGRSLGIQKVFRDEFNCKSIFATYPERQDFESCKDLDYLDAESPESIGSFKTPTLRNLRDTAPYMHDGRFSTLGEVLRHYNLMNSLPAIGFKEEVLVPLGLDPFELDLLERFLTSLNSSVRDLTEGR